LTVASRNGDGQAMLRVEAGATRVTNEGDTAPLATNEGEDAPLATNEGEDAPLTAVQEAAGAARQTRSPSFGQWGQCGGAGMAMKVEPCGGLRGSLHGTWPTRAWGV